MATQGPKFKDCLCRMLANLADTGVPKIERTALVLLIDLLFCKASHYAAFVHAGSLIRELVTSKRKDLFITRLSSKFEATGGSKHAMEEIMSVVTSLLQLRDAKSFLRDQCDYLLPPLVVCSAAMKRRHAEQASSKKLLTPVAFVAEYLGVTCCKLLTNNLQHIYPKLVTETAQDRVDECLKFVEGEMKDGIREVLMGHRQKVTTELLMRFDQHPKQVQAALKALVKRKDRKSLSKTDLVSLALFHLQFCTSDLKQICRWKISSPRYSLSSTTWRSF